MKKDKDGTINISDESYEEHIKKLDRETVSPCARCPLQKDCMMVAYCEEYQKWRKKYLSRYGIKYGK